MDENTEKAQQQREIPYPVTNERRLGVDNQWMTNVGSMNPILSTRRKSLQLFWANFPSDQHNVTFPFVPSFCNLWPSNQTLGSFFLAVFCGWMVKGAAVREELLLIFTLVSFPFHPLCLRRSFQRSPSRNVWLLSSSFQSTLTPNTGVCVFAFKCPTETTLNCLKTIFLLRFSNRCH